MNAAGRPLDGRVALVVGGSGGIGAEVALALAKLGAKLIVHGGSSEQRLRATLERARALGSVADGFLAGLDSIAAAGPVLEHAHEADILVVAHGPFLQAPLHETSAIEWERLASMNLALPGALVSASLPGMRARRWGRILLFGGTRTELPRAFRTNAAYAACKTGLASLVRSIAAEYANDGIASLLACPGLVDTEYLSPSNRTAWASKAPGGRLTAASALGAWLADRLADEPPLWNGASVNLDEGLGSF
ncbi:MAG: SDR family NAD(P)-dependent oxidoreductase [Spirochaetales bacterium]|nr:SDR family NAD(P)-dependent oxidoreductase [Spirochaetales bacterium]